MVKVKPKRTFDVLLRNKKPKHLLITWMLRAFEDFRLHGIGFVGDEINTVECRGEKIIHNL